METNKDSINSLHTFDDLAPIKSSRELSKNGKILLSIGLFVVIACCLYALSGSTLPNRNTLSVESSKELDAASIAIVAAYDKNDFDNTLFVTKQVEGFKDLYITFFKTDFLTTSFIGQYPRLLTRYFAKGTYSDLEILFDPKAQVLLHRGSLTQKPIFIGFSELTSSFKRNMPLTFGILHGSIVENEEESCVQSPNLCTILDVYTQNKTATDKFLNASTLESTTSIMLPIYFVGISQ